MRALLFLVCGVIAAAQTPVLPRCTQPGQVPTTAIVTIGGISLPVFVCAVPSTPTPAPSFVDGETPGGTIDGINAAFTLASVPNPAASVHLHRNGIRLSPGADFTLQGAAITFKPGAIPQPGDILTADYRK